jgi:glycerate-2-kinase
MKMHQVSRIYHSREDRISDIHGENDRVQWSGDELDKISELSKVVEQYSGKLTESVTEYHQAVAQDADEDYERNLRYARQEMIEKWALAQAAISKVAYVLRFDGNTAYERMINALKSGDAVDMRGL